MVTSAGAAGRHPVRATVVAPDVVGSRMAGPGLRSIAIARELSASLDVRLAVGVEGSEPTGLDLPGVQIRTYHDRAGLEAIVLDSDIVFCQFFDTNVAELAVRAGVRLVYDLYNVLPIETIGAERISGFTTQPEMDREFGQLIEYFRSAVRLGSYFVASNERQRDFWLGYLMAADALLPSSFGGRDLDDIIGLAPFGLENEDPVQHRHALRGSHGISEDDIVAIWAGGIWDWFDAETPIRAVAALRGSNPAVKLVFYGTVHPNSVVGRPANVDRAMRLAEELGVLGSQVIFLDEWVAAAERADYLLDADLAISAHRASLETRFSFRTRILDHLWARLPSIVTEGDVFADYLQDHGAGVVVPCGDVDAMAAAIGSLAASPDRRREMRDAIDRVRDRWRWRVVMTPLRERLASGLDGIPQPAAATASSIGTAPGVRSDHMAAPAEPPSQPSSLRRALSASPVGSAYRRLRRSRRG